MIRIFVLSVISTRPTATATFLTALGLVGFICFILLGSHNFLQLFVILLHSLLALLTRCLHLLLLFLSQFRTLSAVLTSTKATRSCSRASASLSAHTATHLVGIFCI